MVTFVETFGSIPFVIVAIIFASLVYWIPSFFLVYHLTRFGIGVRPRLIALVFLVGSVILFSVFILTLSRMDLLTLFP